MEYVSKWFLAHNDKTFTTKFAAGDADRAARAQADATKQLAEYYVKGCPPSHPRAHRSLTHIYKNPHPRPRMRGAVFNFKIPELWESLDKDKDRCISRDELQRGMAEYCVARRAEAEAKVILPRRHAWRTVPMPHRPGAAKH